MKERPILFSAPMVRAILGGRKTQTRRIINRVTGIGPITEFQRTDTRGYDWIFRDRRMLWNDLRHADLLRRCPYGGQGDRLWVRETWGLAHPCYHSEDEGLRLGRQMHNGRWCFYRATDSGVENGDDVAASPWRPSIHMPRWASRIDLEIVSVRIERLLDISEADACAEGVKSREAFLALWDEINGKGSAAQNPFVWALEFKCVERVEEVEP